jgi:hypothetical protein
VIIEAIPDGPMARNESFGAACVSAMSKLTLVILIVV